MSLAPTITLDERVHICLFQFMGAPLVSLIKRFFHGFLFIGKANMLEILLFSASNAHLNCLEHVIVCVFKNHLRK